MSDTASLPSLVTASSSCMSSDHSSDAETDLDLSSSSGEVTSDDFTSPKEAIAQHADRAEPGEEDGDEEEEEEEDEDEEEVEDAAGTEDEKWEVESNEKEGDGNPAELEGVQLSIDRRDGYSFTSMPTAGLLLDTGSDLTCGQQTGDQPMSLHSASSAEHPPETEMNSSPPSAAARLSPANAVPSTRQEQNGDMQAQLTAGLLSDLARSDPPDTAAQDEIDPEMMARLVRLRLDDSPGTGGMSGESGEGTAVEPTEQASRLSSGDGELEEGTAVEPTEQATRPSNGDTPPPQPRIMLHVSPQEPIEGEMVDFELLNVPLCGIGDVEWRHCGRLLPQAVGLHYTINSQKDAGVYQCVIYKEPKKINIVAVVEVTLHVKKSTDVTGQPCLEEEGGSGGSNGKEEPGDSSGDARLQTEGSLPGSGRNGTSDQSAQGNRDHAAGTSVLGAVYYSIALSELMDDADLLEEVKVKLDPDCCGRKNWRHLGAKLGNIPRDQLEYFACHGRRTEAVLERVTSERPDTSVGDLMNVLYQIKRGDVVETIKQNM
ncbi:uncharacterized protein LOC118419948 [Branchiostoma floridae]|uniref:Uncharacterized protein LOC118419948 n=1 Tax=Branchiostoma floridae TaxID=7739 RepID=A0A9J7LHT3_BRAFL|nr:uncharacterized protein LOC118419948 [Branchiostoma floridae]